MLFAVRDPVDFAPTEERLGLVDDVAAVENPQLQQRHPQQRLAPGISGGGLLALGVEIIRDHVVTAARLVWRPRGASLSGACSPRRGFFYGA